MKKLVLLFFTCLLFIGCTQNPKPHVHTEKEIIINPTCQEKGKLTVICEECEEVLEEKELAIVNCEYNNQSCIWCNTTQGIEYGISNGTAYVKGMGYCTLKDIVIAESYKGKPVTKIG